MRRRHHPQRIRLRVTTALLAVTTLALSACGGVSGGGTGGGGASGASGVLTIGMTAGDIPNLDTVLSGGQGFEGYRFVGNQLYDGLTKFDLKQATETPKVIGGLATSWTSNATASAWTFQLRPGVSFTDGTPFNADAVIYNLDRYLNKKSPHFDAAASAQAALSLGGIKSYKKITDTSLEIDTNGPYSHLPEDLIFIYMASPTALQKYGNTGFAEHPVGTGPFIFSSETRGQQATFTANPHYWNGTPKISKLVLKPIPDASARLAALRSGEVNWIEAPGPDDIASLKSSGYQIFTNGYDHVWPWILDMSKKPLNDVRVREAMNYAIDRKTMASALLQGTADPAYQLAPRASLAYQSANDVFSYDPAKAKSLLAAAGYPNGFSMSLSYPTSGSGNMEPGPMNQELQSDLAKVGIKVKLQPIEWATMLTDFATGKIPGGANAINISLTFIQESFWSLLFSSQSPLNAGHYKNVTVDKLLGEALAQPDAAKRSDIYAQIAAQVDKDAAWLVIVNDRNPRALASNVHGFVEPKSWFVDLTTVTVG
jgi:peptide/nickel transport system substrate-binding protein